MNENKAKLEWLVKLLGNTPFSYFNKGIEENIKIYDYYRDFTKDLMIFLNSQASNDQVTKNQFSYQYIKNPKVNAGAKIEQNEEKIFITEGLILKIYELFYKLNTQDNTLGLEMESLNAQPPVVVNLHTSMSFHDGGVITAKLPVTTCNKLNIVADYMAMIAIKFVIAHEAGHLYDGHCDYKKRYSHNQNSDFQLHQKTILDLPTLELHALETDADSFAICRLIDIVIPTLLKEETLASIIKDQKDIFKILGWSIAGLFWLIEEEFKDSSQPFTQSHPPVLIRLINSLGSGKRKLELMGYNEELSNALFVGTTDCYKVLKQSIGIEEIKSEENVQHMKNIRETWLELRTKLVPYARGALAE